MKFYARFFILFLLCSGSSDDCKTSNGSSGSKRKCSIKEDFSTRCLFLYFTTLSFKSEVAQKVIDSEKRRWRRVRHDTKKRRWTSKTLNVVEQVVMMMMQKPWHKKENPNKEIDVGSEHKKVSLKTVVLNLFCFKFQ